MPDAVNPLHIDRWLALLLMLPTQQAPDPAIAIAGQRAHGQLDLLDQGRIVERPATTRLRLRNRVRKVTFLWETTWSAASTGSSVAKGVFCLASSIADSTEEPRRFEAITDVYDAFMTMPESAWEQALTKGQIAQEQGDWREHDE